MSELAGNLLCYGNNLGFLTDTSLFPDESIDLIYLDPPFNSQQDYNVLFKEASGLKAAAQIQAFDDTWTWDSAANDALVRIHQDPAVPSTLVELMRTFMNFLKPTPMAAYLVQMAIRLVHMHRVLKPTGSLYLHCDPTASHYLKLVLDAVFEMRCFQNELAWKRTTTKGDYRQGAQNWPRIHDVVFYYSKTVKPGPPFNQPFEVYSEDYLRVKYKYTDGNGRIYRLDNLTAPGAGSRGHPKYEFLGVTRYWRYNKEKMQHLFETGRVIQTRPGTVPQYKRFLDEMPGTSVGDFWGDIPPINSQAQERLGYPTQKPLELLKRIVSASSNPGDVILDPFCGCGTTIDAVETLNRENPDKPPRRWVGIDITQLATSLIKHRLTRFVPPPVYEIIGEPVSASEAEALAQQDPYQFQFWALGLIGARPVGGKKKKGADQGIDGVRYFIDEMRGNQPVTKTLLVQVKGGNVGSKDIRDLVGTLARENAELGVFLTLNEPTKPMRTEAASAGSYISPWNQQAYPKIQILTVGELLKDPLRPNPNCLLVPGGFGQHTLPEPEKHRRRSGDQKGLFPKNK